MERVTRFLLVAGESAVSETAEAPFQRVKLLQQCQDELVRSGRLSKPYKGLADCFAREIRREGILSLWRGNVAGLIRKFASQALNLAFNYCFNRLVSLKKVENGYWKWFAKTMESVGRSGACHLFFLHSLDFARTRLANDIRAGKNGGQRQFSGLLDVYKKTLKSDGVAGLYRGFGIACSVMVLRWAVNECLQRVVLKIRPLKNLWAKLVVVCAVKMGVELACYPADTVKRRMMMTSGEAVKYRSSLHEFRCVVRGEGIRPLFNGAPVNILRWIAGAAALAAYDICKPLNRPRQQMPEHITHHSSAAPQLHAVFQKSPALTTVDSDSENDDPDAAQNPITFHLSAAAPPVTECTFLQESASVTDYSDAAQHLDGAVQEISALRTDDSDAQYLDGAVPKISTLRTDDFDSERDYYDAAQQMNGTDQETSALGTDNSDAEQDSYDAAQHMDGPVQEISTLRTVDDDDSDVSDEGSGDFEGSDDFDVSEQSSSTCRVCEAAPPVLNNAFLQGLLQHFFQQKPASITDDSDTAQHLRRAIPHLLGACQHLLHVFQNKLASIEGDSDGAHHLNCGFQQNPTSITDDSGAAQHWRCAVQHLLCAIVHMLPTLQRKLASIS